MHTYTHAHTHIYTLGGKHSIYSTGSLLCLIISDIMDSLMTHLYGYSLLKNLIISDFPYKLEK